MNFSFSWSSQKKSLLLPSRLFWLLLTLVLMSMISLTGCLERGTEIQYSQLANKSKRLKGAMKVAQDKVKVTVEGTTKVSEFSPAAGYYMVHADDLDVLVVNSKILVELSKDEAIKAKIKQLEKDLTKEDN